jgi:hypothetical protein
MTDLDPMLREAMSRVRGPIDARPSLVDVRRRARRRNRRRMSATVGVVACAGVATTALIIRRDSVGSSASGDSVATDAPTASTLYGPGGSTTTTVFGQSTITITPATVWDALWNAHNDPSGVAVMVAPPAQDLVGRMPTPEQFGCTTNECRAMFTYVVWHEIAKTMGFSDVIELQAVNPNIDFSVPPVEGAVLQTLHPNSDPNGDVTATTGFDETPSTLSLFDGVVLIDGGAPAGAMDDVYQRLAGFNRTIVPSSGKTAAQSEIMPIADTGAMAAAVGNLLGIDGFDTWDPSFVADPVQGMVAVVIGPDYWDRVQHASPPATTTTTPATTTTTMG